MMKEREKLGVWVWVWGVGAAAVLAALLMAGGGSASCISSGVRPAMARSKEEADIRVLVPLIRTFPQFVDCSDPANVTGFCVDVFEQALLSIPGFNHSTVSYTCFNLSAAVNKASTNMTSYDIMVQQLQYGGYDIVVGDVTISAKRYKWANFTQPFLPSGIAIFSKVQSSSTSPWLLFAAPFTLRMWCTIVGAFAFVALIMGIMEYRIDHRREGGHEQLSIISRIQQVAWVVVDALILLQRDNLQTSGAQAMMVAWLFFVLLLGQSYSAGLNSFLTASNLSPTIMDVSSLRSSGGLIGVWNGSIVKDFLIDRFHFNISTFQNLTSVDAYKGNLTKQEVIAVVDEIPYVELTLHNLTTSASCDYQVSAPLTNEGFGLAIRKDFHMSSDMFSKAILNLTWFGCLQELQNRSDLYRSYQCQQDSDLTSITWENALVLFVLLLAISIICVLVHNLELVFVNSHKVGRMISTYIEPRVLQITSRESFRIRERVGFLKSEHFL